MVKAKKKGRRNRQSLADASDFQMEPTTDKKVEAETVHALGVGIYIYFT